MTIHLIAPKEKNKWPDIWHHCYNIWKSSSYKIKLWNDEEDIDQLLKEDDEEFFNILNTLPKIYKIDYVRYIILEKFKGAYFNMDIEVVRDFFPLLNSNKIYLMEGTGGTYIENSIMIVPSNNNTNLTNYFTRVKLFCKQKVLKNQKSLKSETVVELVGAIALSEFFIKHKPSRDHYDFDILSYEHFASLHNSISFSRHHQTSEWNK